MSAEKTEVLRSYMEAPRFESSPCTRHTDAKTGIRTTGPHKHFWDEEYEDNRVYIPDDIRNGDPNEELIDFLAECNIDLRASYDRESFSRFRQGGLL